MRDYDEDEWLPRNPPSQMTLAESGCLTAVIIGAMLIGFVLGVAAQ